MQTITTFSQFLTAATQTTDIYTLIETQCTDEVRDFILSHATDSSAEPFRESCYIIGLQHNIQQLVSY